MRHVKNNASRTSVKFDTYWHPRFIIYMSRKRKKYLYTFSSSPFTTFRARSTPWYWRCQEERDVIIFDICHPERKRADVRKKKKEKNVRGPDDKTLRKLREEGLKQKLISSLSFWMTRLVEFVEEIFCTFFCSFFPLLRDLLLPHQPEKYQRVQTWYQKKTRNNEKNTSRAKKIGRVLGKNCCLGIKIFQGEE